MKPIGHDLYLNQIIDEKRKRTHQGANIALGRLMDADFIQKIHKGRQFIYKIKSNTPTV